MALKLRTGGSKGAGIIMQAYCDIEDEMVKGMFGTIVQGYLKKGYNRATAEMMAREFFRYES